MRSEFVPGAVWTPALQREAVRRMTESYESPAMQALFGQLTNESHVPPIEGLDLPEPADIGPVDAGACVARRARLEDIPSCMRLLIMWNLPPLFIDEFLPGFIVVEHKGDLIGCGANEIYDGSAVLRSVVVDERARRLKLGRTMSELLIEDAVAAGAADIYLFTEQARIFWLTLGFEDVAIDDWPAAPRACWQWRYLATHRDVLANVFPMRKRVDA